MLICLPRLAPAYIHIPTYTYPDLPTHLPTYPPTHLPTCAPTHYPPTHLPTRVHKCVDIHAQVCVCWHGSHRCLRNVDDWLDAAARKRLLERGRTCPCLHLPQQLSSVVSREPIFDQVVRNQHKVVFVVHRAVLSFIRRTLSRVLQRIFLMCVLYQPWGSCMEAVFQTHRDTHFQTIIEHTSVCRSIMSIKSKSTNEP